MDKHYFLFQQLLKDSDAINARAGHSPRQDDHRRMKRGGSAASLPALCLLERINARRARGESFASIAAELNKQGFTGRYGGRWYAGSVWAYLQRRS